MTTVASGASRPLCHHPEPHCGEVMVESIGDPDARALHDGKAGRIDSRQLMQVGTLKVVPGLLQVAELAREYPHCARLIDRMPPRQCHVAVGIPIEEREGLD